MIEFDILNKVVYKIIIINYHKMYTYCLKKYHFIIWLKFIDLIDYLKEFSIIGCTLFAWLFWLLKLSFNNYSYYNLYYIEAI